MPDTAANIWGDFVTTGVPSSGKKKPKKSEIRAWGAWIESLLNAIGVNSGTVYTTRAILFANLQPAANSMAWVIADPNSAYNGIYQKNGATNSGSWTRVGDLPYSFIVASDVGAGTPNAIQATTTIPISESALIWFPVFEANTGSPVTVSFNGETPLTIKTNGGNDPVAGGLASGCVVMGIKAGSTFRLLSDQASASIVAAAEAAAADAANYAALARNDVVVNSFTGDGVTTDFTLTVDPGSANNMRVNVTGATQLHASYSLVYVSTVPKIRFSEAPPNGVAFEVEMGFRIAVGSPATGSVTYDKIQNITATLRLLGRKTAGAGVTEEISAAELRDLFLPVGSVVQSSRAVYTANAALSTVIPMDDTIPQITEGTEIISIAMTPVSTTNKFRIRFEGQGAAASASAQLVWGIFRVGTSNALQAGYVQAPSIDFAYQMAGGAEYVPGVLTAETIKLRVGANSGNMRMNGTSAARFLGGASAVEMIVEEIKA
jgi:hypothetical protein